MGRKDHGHATRPTIVIAGTRYAIELLAAVLEPHFEVLGATSMEEALAQCGRADLVVCNVRFDDSRMFDFLRALAGRPGPKVPVICCRVHPEPLSANTRRAIEQALETLGIPSFLDRPALLERQAPEAVDETLRQMVRERLTG